MAIALLFHNRKHPILFNIITRLRFISLRAITLSCLFFQQDRSDQKMGVLLISDLDDRYY